jgi:hypothetical protein
VRILGFFFASLTVSGEVLHAQAPLDQSSWKVVNNGLPSTYVSNLIVDPSSPNTLYALTVAPGNCGLFKTTDAAETWKAVVEMNQLGCITALAVDPRNPAVIYAGSRSGAFKSVDGGLSWSSLGLPGTASIAIAPSRSDIVYAGTYGDRLYKSTDSGETWNAARVQAPPPTGALGWQGGFLQIDLLVIDPIDPETLYVADKYFADWEWFNDLMKSKDGGLTWSRYSGHDRDVAFFSFAVDPTAPRTLYAGNGGYGRRGVIMSVDDNVSWVETGLTNLLINAVAIDPHDPNTLYAASAAGWAASPGGPVGLGIFTSTDKGATWSSINEGLTDHHITGLVAAGTSPTAIFAVTSTGVFRLMTAPPAFQITFGSPSVHLGGSFSATLSGTNLNPNTFFDIRFRSPGSDADQISLNWQRGTVAAHELPGTTAAGTWTITGVRAHEDPDDHAASFISVSGELTVNTY